MLSVISIMATVFLAAPTLASPVPGTENRYRNSCSVSIEDGPWITASCNMKHCGTGIRTMDLDNWLGNQNGILAYLGVALVEAWSLHDAYQIGLYPIHSRYFSVTYFTERQVNRKLGAWVENLIELMFKNSSGKPSIMAEAIAETISISAVPSESASVIRTLLHANLFRVFAERDPLTRLQAIKETYAEDIVWFESPNNVIRGREALNARAAELLDRAPGWKFKEQSEMTTVGNMGVLKWGFGPGDEVTVQGIDVVIAEAGKVKVLWTGLEGA